MSSPNDTEKSILATSKAFDDALAARDVSKLRGTLAAGGAVLHHDGLTLGEDVRGADDIVHYFQTYFDKYDFTHNVIAGAVDSNDSTAFSFWRDEGVKLKSKSQGPDTTVGIWHHVLDGDFKIAETWFLRQLSSDEVDSKLHKAPEQGLPVDPTKWTKSSLEQNEQRGHAQVKAAKTFNEIWRVQDASAAKDIMAPTVKIYDPVFGSTTEGVENFEKMIAGFAETWKVDSNQSHTASTHGDKAFIWWQSSGHSTRDSKGQDQLYGLNMLVFNKESQITEVLGFRQPTKLESHKMVKAQIQKDDI